MNQLTVVALAQLPALITASGDRASWRFMEFFTAAIRNPNTRRAYAARRARVSHLVHGRRHCVDRRR